MRQGGMIVVAAVLMTAPPLIAQEPAEAPAVAASVASEAVPVAASELDRTLSFSPRLNPEPLLEVVALKAARRSANIVVNAVVGPDGKVVSAEIGKSSGDAALDEALRAYILSAKALPPKKAGQPVSVRVPVDLWLGHESRKIAGEEPVLSDEMKRLGHHGPVVARGTIQPDGSLADIAIVKTSKSPLVDAAVLAALPSYRFDPPADATGAYFARPIDIEFGMSQADNGGGTVLGLPKYRCDAFIAEYDWWRSVNPEAAPKDYRLRTILLGLSVIMGLQKTSSASADLLGAVRRMDGAWDGAVERCRKKPGMLFLDAYKKAQ